MTTILLVTMVGTFIYDGEFPKQIERAIRKNEPIPVHDGAPRAQRKHFTVYGQHVVASRVA